ncbi:MAG: hypothetical protein ABSF44_12865 [Candidatus Bathyarchaeia archaeon]|jgi:hypothetical protein
MSKNLPYWFVRNGAKLIQCSKADFDKAITEGKSVKYHGYPNKKTERIAEQLEESRMTFLAKPDLPPKFRAAITCPRNVVEVQVIMVDDEQFWVKESKRPKYQI